MRPHSAGCPSSTYFGTTVLYRYSVPICLRKQFPLPASNIHIKRLSTLEQNSLQTNIAMAQPQAFCFTPALHDILSRAVADVPPFNGPTSLSIGNVTSAATGLKLSVQKARAVLALFPGITTTIEEQEVEIVELEKALSGLQSVKGGLAIVELQTKNKP